MQREGGVSVATLTLGFLSTHVSLLMSNSNVSVDIDSLFLHFVAGIGKARNICNATPREQYKL
jgi:hypothetical protein